MHLSLPKSLYGRLLIIFCLLTIVSLVGCKRQPSRSDKRTPHEVAHSSDVDRMRRLLDAGLDPNAIDENGHSLLYRAVHGNQLDMARLLLDAGADIELSTNGTRRTPIFQAAYNGRSSGGFKLNHDPSDDAPILELLIERGANVNARNAFGWTPLHDAVAGENPHVVRILLEHGANPTAEDEDGASPTDLAVQHDREECLALLNAASEEQTEVEAGAPDAPETAPSS